MNKIASIIDQIFEGIELPQEQKNTLITIYTLNSLKTIFDTLVGLTKGDQDFINKITNLYDLEIAKLSSNDKIIFDKIISEENAKNLSSVIDIFASNLPVELRNKINENLKLIKR